MHLSHRSARLTSAPSQRNNVNPVLGAAYRVAGHVATAIAAVAPASGNKLVRTFADRKGVVNRFEAWASSHRDPTRSLVWFHAPSVGEGLQARPVIELLRSRNPTLQVVFTHFSPSAVGFAQKLQVDYADYLPFDTAGSMRRVVAALQPDALVFSKLDVWPVLCLEAHNQSVKLGMISGTLAASSPRLGTLARALTDQAYSRFEAVGVIASGDGRRLLDLGVPPGAIREIGDTRYDQVWQRAHRADGQVTELLNVLRSERPTLVAGSTWPADESALFDAWLDVRRVVPTARLIIAPHEPTSEHLAPIRQWAAESGLAVDSLSDATATTDVVVVDRIGVLGDLYALGNAAFVGGGFHGAGLHSVLEPAAFGLPVAFGPQHTRSRDATVLIEHDAARDVRDARQLAHVVSSWLSHAALAQAAGTSGREVVERGLGAAERSCALVESLLRARSD